MNISVFGALVLVTLVVVIRVGRSNRTASDYYTAGQSFTGPQNGVAIAGDFLSVASFLGVAGLTAQFGYDGFMLAVGAFVTWLVALLLVAEPLRNTGRFTMGDVIARRTRPRPARSAAAVSTLVVSFFYLFTQLVGAGGLIALLLGLDRGDELGQDLVIAVTGVLMIVYVLAGGMKGTTWVQIIKASLLMVCTLVLAFWVIGRYGFDFSALLADAVRHNPAQGEGLLVPGLQSPGPLAKVDSASQAIALVLGSAALPHVMMRFYTVPSAREARRSVVWAIWLIGGFYVALTVVGFGGSALVGSDRIAATPGGSNSAVPLLAYRLGGELMLGLVAAVAFATILAVVAGLTIAASASFAHDIYATVLRRGTATSAEELRVARRTALVIGVCAIAAAMIAKGQNVGSLAILAFAIAASANLPTLLYSLFWRRFSTAGALCSIYGGLALSFGLILLSPAVSGTPKSMLPHLDFAVFPLTNPGLVSIPGSFLLGVLGTLFGPRDTEAALRYAEVEVRSLTGAAGIVATPGPEHADAEQTAREHAGAEQAIQERAVREHAEAERVEAERVDAERVDAERVDAERLDAEQPDPVAVAAGRSASDDRPVSPRAPSPVPRGAREEEAVTMPVRTTGRRVAPGSSATTGKWFVD